MSIKISPSSAKILVVVSASRPTTVMLGGTPGPSGQEGKPGKDGDPIGGFPLNIKNPKPRDVLMFNGNAWANDPSAKIVDGGNF